MSEMRPVKNLLHYVPGEFREGCFSEEFLKGKENGQVIVMGGNRMSP